MPKTYANSGIKKIYAGGLIKKVYAHYGPGQTDLVFSASNTVTYVVDTGVSFAEEVEYGTSCLNPKSFTPVKSGWTFCGWREDTTATASILTEKVMDIDPVILYAVFKKTVTLSYNGNGSTGGSVSSQTGTAYYNGAGNMLPAQFVLYESSYSRIHYNFSRWAIGSISDNKYNAGATISLFQDTTAYAMWIAETYKSSVFTIHGYGNTNWPNAMDKESEIKTLIASMDLTGYSSITFYIGTFYTSDVVNSANNNRGSYARIYIDNELVVTLNTKSTTNDPKSGTYTLTSADVGSHSIKHSYYQMDGNCKAENCQITFTSSGQEV